MVASRRFDKEMYMQIVIPTDVKYKGAIQKAHTPFNCDSSDFQRFVPLGAWAFKEEKAPKTKDKESK